MRILTRLVMVLVLLGALAYGSYGLGKYVLSNKLFGNTVTPVEGSVLEAGDSAPKKRAAERVSITGKPHVEVDILPADEADPGPEIPSIAALQKSGREGSGKKSTSGDNTQNTRSENKTREFSTNDPTPRFRSGYDSSGDGRSYRADSRDDDEDRPRRRRRRRRYSDDDNSRSSERTSTRRRRRRSSSSSSNDSPVPRAESSRSERSQSSGSRSQRSESSRPSRSESSSSSPVPRPEGGSSTLGGSESPIPQPE